MNKTTVSKSLHAHNILEELERMIYADMDDNKDSSLEEFLSVISNFKQSVSKFREQYYKVNIDPFLDEEWLDYAIEKNLDPSNTVFKTIFIDASKEKAIYIAELEGILSGDPSLQSEGSTREYWLAQARNTIDKLSKKIKDLEDFRHGRSSKSGYFHRKNE